MQVRYKVLIFCMVLLGAMACFQLIPQLRMSPPGRIIRFFLGEPRIVQWVNDTADQIASKKLNGDLDGLSKEILAEFLPKLTELKKSEFTDGRIIPVERLPILYRQFDSIFGFPELLLFPSSGQQPAFIAISWGHMREAIIVFSAPPASSPPAFYRRKITETIFVISGE